MHHVLAEFFGARIGIVIRTVPIDRAVFLNDFVLARSRDRHRGNMRKAAQPVPILRAPRKLNHLERATQIYIHALLF